MFLAQQMYYFLMNCIYIYIGGKLYKQKKKLRLQIKEIHDYLETK